MKITLIAPFPTLEAIGLRTLSSCLKKEGHNVQILFLRSEFWQKYTPSVLQEAAELSKDSGLIGISLMTNFFDNAVTLTEQLRKTVGVPILWGGIHPTIRPEESLAHADIVCLGEGEDPLIELARKMERGQDYRDTRGLWFRDRGAIRRNELHAIRRDLDSLPFPDINFEDHFVLVNGKIKKMDLKLTEKYLGRGDRDYMILASRGCPYGCAYCANNTLHQMDKDYRIVRKRSPANLIGELITAKKKLPYIQSIKFSDDAFFTYPENDIREFCESYKKHIGLPLRIKGIHPATCTRAKLAMVVDAGCDAVRMGIETCSEQTKILYKRNYSNQAILESVDLINGFRDRIQDIQYDIILDNPWESDDDLVETLMTLVKFKPPYYLALFSLTFYPETELYRKAKSEGLVKDDLSDVYRKFYRKTKNTYLNNLFHLLNMYALERHQLPPQFMTMLTSRLGRCCGSSYVLYVLMLGERKMFRILKLLFKGLNALRKGDWGRLTRWLRRFFAPSSF
ncbi:MAG: radical SAM protein [Candidatus Omnitrophota bacterium]